MTGINKNLLCHFYFNNVYSLNDVNKFHLYLLNKYQSVFNGEKIIFAALDNIDDMNQKNKVFDTFGFLKNISILKIIPNHPTNRESESLIDLFKSVKNKESLSFYCHNKGSTWPLDLTLKHWIASMYFFNLENEYIEDVEKNLLRNFSCSGILKKDVRCDNMLGADWHYSGAFFWVNTLKLFNISGWDIADKHRMGLESYIGRKISSIAAYSTFISRNYNFDMTHTLWENEITPDKLKSDIYNKYREIIDS